MSQRWHVVASVDDVGEDTPVAAEIGDVEIAVFKVEDAYVATQGVCPHAYALLADGFVEDGVVECPLHRATFEIVSGKCLGPPAEEDLDVYPVRVEDGKILVALAAD